MLSAFKLKNKNLKNHIFKGTKTHENKGNEP